MYLQPSPFSSTVTNSPVAAEIKNTPHGIIFHHLSLRGSCVRGHVQCCLSTTRVFFCIFFFIGAKDFWLWFYLTRTLPSMFAVSPTWCIFMPNRKHEFLLYQKWLLFLHVTISLLAASLINAFSACHFMWMSKGCAFLGPVILYTYWYCINQYFLRCWINILWINCDLIFFDLNLN